MSDEVLRHPLTFWQWLTNQPGNIYSPPLPTPPSKPLTAIDVINMELKRIHDQIEAFRCDNDYGSVDDHIENLVNKLDKLHTELAKRLDK